jgi:hypothetical protein
MDPENRRQMEGSAEAIPRCVYVLAQIKPLGRKRGMAEGGPQIFRRP